MIDNAVAHYHHLREQGLMPSAAVDHTVQRFGVPKATLYARVNGRVADPETTRQWLANAKARIETDSDAYADEDIIRGLYEAITGETLTAADDGDPKGWCHVCNRDLWTKDDHAPMCEWRDVDVTDPRVAADENSMGYNGGSPS